MGRIDTTQNQKMKLKPQKLVQDQIWDVAQVVNEIGQVHLMNKIKLKMKTGVG